MTAKEFAGIERSIASAGFASGALEVGGLLQLQSLISRQSLALQWFDEFSSNMDVSNLQQITRLPETEDVQRMREIAFSSGPNGDLSGISAEEFFAASSARIDLLKNFEAAVVQDIEGFAEGLYQRSFMTMCLVLSAVLVVGAASIWITRFSIHSLEQTHGLPVGPALA